MRNVFLITAVAMTLSAIAIGELRPRSAHTAVTPSSSAPFCSGIEGAVDELVYDELAAEQLLNFPTIHSFCILRYIERHEIDLTGQDETPEDIH